MSDSWRPLGQILTERFGLSVPRLDEALAIQKEKGGRLGAILVRLGAIREDQLIEALAVQFQLPFLPELEPKQIDANLVARVPIGFAKRFELIPVRLEENRALVATTDPTRVHVLDDLRALLGVPIVPALSSSKQILHCINQIYDRASDTAEQVIEDLSDESLNILASELPEAEDLLDATDEAPIIRLVNSVLFQAVKQRASDIHFETFEREMEIRFRIDGILYKIISPPRRFQASIVSRIKIMAGLNIAEKRLPQDGRIGVKIAGRDIDIRVSVIPTAFGERVVLRLLDKAASLLGFEEIGLSHDELKLMDQLIHLSHGIVLVTGPTGSGKTTTLYAALNKINSPDKNIITIEDPIEYQLKGIGQMQVNPKINLTFANGLRSILRQDPDMIMVGEIRDAETAEIAIHASLTGHLVFSTLHTNDAAGAITRLLDMGIEAFLVSSSVIAIIAQRLVRVICTACKQEYRPTPEELSKLGFETGAKAPVRFFRGEGCGNCLGTGYRGRSGIYEILPLDEELRQMILGKADAGAIKARAIKKGVRTLRENGARKVLAGTTTTEEVLRVTQEELVAG